MLSKTGPGTPPDRSKIAPSTPGGAREVLGYPPGSKNGENSHFPVNLETASGKKCDGPVLQQSLPNWQTASSYMRSSAPVLHGLLFQELGKIDEGPVLIQYLASVASFPYVEGA